VHRADEPGADDADARTHGRERERPDSLVFLAARSGESVPLLHPAARYWELLLLVKQKFRDLWVEFVLRKRLSAEFFRRGTAKTFAFHRVKPLRCA
jgi:hypothetical protein